MIETSGVSKPIAGTYLNPSNAVFDEAHQAATSNSDETHFVTDLRAFDVPSS